MIALHRYEAALLKVLKKGKELRFDELGRESGLERDELLWALENLKDQGLAEVEYEHAKSARLTDEGESYAKDGLPEERLLRRLEKGTVEIRELTDKEGQIAVLWLKKGGLAEIQNGKVLITAKGIEALSKGIAEAALLKKLIEDPSSFDKTAQREQIANLVARRLIAVEEKRIVSRVRITKKGEAAEISEEKGAIDSLDRSIIANGSWKGKRFKEYDVDVKVEAAIGAREHPLRNIISDVKNAYLGMGFKEVTGPAIESSFWVFDSLFVPQEHPVRDMQDTFYITNPSSLRIDDAAYAKKLGKAHEGAWHQRWSHDAARQAVLRTHMTSVSARYVRDVIKKLIIDENAFEMPVKLFSIGRIFRNENIDYKHLADFYQSDGIIIGKGLTMANLFDTLSRLYESLGIKIRFKPSYFPFVEPGVEYQAYSKKTNEWVEMGGAGILRNEITGMTRKNISVLAWGVGIERLLLIKDPTLTSISELYNSSIGWLRKRRMVV